MTAEAARALIDRTFVWDHHACLPLRPHDESFLPELERHRAAGFDAVTVNIGFGDQGVEEHLRVLAAFRRWLKERPAQYRLIETADDAETARRDGRLAVGFDIEGANAIGDQASLVSMYHDLGVRWMSIAYNRANRVGGGCQEEDGGLTSFGREVVREMERVGMVVCLSHTGHRTARDVLAMARRPVIFSHSNASALFEHPRNIPDALMRACAATGGVIGINGVGIFLDDRTAASESYVRHLDHAVQTVGPAHVTIALDYVFDQVELETAMATMAHTFPPGLGYDRPSRFVAPEQLAEIVELLLARGYGEADLTAILGGNLLRIARGGWQPLAG